jgi:DNA/RNA-binding domain of Phe-tRNA-synthetase-like protein
VGNLVSIRYALPIAIFDIRQLVGDNLSVRLAMGNETFLPIGSDGIEHPDTGEVIFADMDANVYARRWCWRQSLASAAQEDTTQVIVTVEAHHTGGLTDIESALADLMQLLTDYAGFSGRVGVVSATIGINLSKKSQGRRSRAALVLGGMGEQIIDQLSV